MDIIQLDDLNNLIKQKISSTSTLDKISQYLIRDKLEIIIKDQHMSNQICTLEQMIHILQKKVIRKEEKIRFSNLFEPIYVSYKFIINNDLLNKEKQKVNIKEKQKVSIHNKSNNVNVKEIIENLNKKDTNDIPTWDNKKFVDIINKQIEFGKNIIITNYLQRNVMYLYLLCEKGEKNNKKILIKVGYSCDIISRAKSIEKEFNCDIYLLNIKTIENENGERRFHEMLKQTKKHLWIDNLFVDKKQKTEVYLYNEQIMREFSAIEEYDKNLRRNNNEISIETIKKVVEILNSELYKR